MRNFEKDPDEELDYLNDWSALLAADETIATSAWVVPAGITEINDGDQPTDHDNTTAWIWLSGGTLGDTYTITNRITTNQHRTYDRSIRIMIEQR